MDVVERLRQKGERVQIPCPDGIAGCLVYHYQIKTDPDCAEAADIIERMQEWNDNAQKKIGRLETEIERLREALADIADFYTYENISDAECMRDIARSALQQKENE